MKKIAFFIVLVLLVSTSKAQFKENHAIYVSTDGLLGNFYGGQVGLNYVLNQKYSFTASYTEYQRKAQNTPDDYSGGLIGDVLLFGITNPDDEVQCGHILFGRIVPLNEKRTIRLNLQAGIGLAENKQATDWQKLQDDATLNLGANYSFVLKKEHSWSFILQPRIEFPFSRIYGFSVSPMLVVNKEFNYVGVGIGQVIGWLK